MSPAMNMSAASRTIRFIGALVAASWMGIALGQPAFADETGPTARPEGTKEEATADFARSIQCLESTSFQDRQTAYQQLVSAGSSAVDALENAAKAKQLEVAVRCLDILAQIARNQKDKELALAALERLSAEPGHRVAAHAAKLVVDLKTTDEDRAIAALQADGVRITRGSTGKIFVGSLVHDSQLMHLRHIPNLYSVDLSGQGITDVGLEVVAEVKQIVNLSMMRTSVTDNGLRKLKRLTNLESLGLAGQLFTGVGLGELKDIPKLRTLTLMFPVGEPELQLLGGVSQIHLLHLSDVRVSRQCIDIMNRFNHLRRLILSVQKVDDADLRLLGQLQVPLQLTVSTSPNVTRAGWESLGGARLIGLSLFLTPITDADLPHLGAIQTLESLSICDAPITDAGLEHLQRLTALRSLTLRNTRVTDNGVANLQRAIPTLRHARATTNGGIRPRPAERSIHFTVNPESGKRNAHLRSRITAELADQLKAEPALDTVFLTFGDTRDEDLPLLAKVPLRGLVIDSKHVTDRGIKALEGHPTLESLGLWSSSITDRALQSIALIQHLNKLTIQKAEITDQGLATLIERLGETDRIKSFDLFKCPNITNDGVKRIGQLTSLERLLLNNIDGLTSEVLEAIAELRNLNRLEVDSIALDEEDLVHLASLSRLETLGLSPSSSQATLTDRGLAYVSRVPSLQSLAINNAKVTDDGVVHLVKLQRLQSIGLSKTGITDQGLATLAKGLPNLTRLGLSGTKVTNAGMADVGRLTQLEWLWLDATSVGDEGIAQLDGLKKLKYVYLNASTVSGAGYQQFRRAHPATNIQLQ